ncbi:hypothetical protein A4G20_01750 [Pasteurellaceae bacterium RH1A]|nr:hypothetical protein A4G20_01750 [Pasteurellaceae bacterium RH1A]
MKKMLLPLTMALCLGACNNSSDVAQGFAENLFDSSGTNGYKTLTLNQSVLAQNEELIVDGKAYRLGSTLDIGKWNQGLTTKPMEMRNQDGSVQKGNLLVYKQVHSAVLATNLQGQGGDLFSVRSVQGQETTESLIPKQGDAAYEGAAFTAQGVGKFLYNLDFANKQGQGTIRDLPGMNGTLILQEGALVGNKINGKLVQDSQEGAYSLSLFGDKAQEVAGQAKILNQEIGLAGKKTPSLGH